MGLSGRRSTDMRRILAITGPFLIVAVAFGDAAWAQIPQYSAGPSTGTGGPSLKRSNRPVVSPYAGLLGSGVGANQRHWLSVFHARPAPAPGEPCDWVFGEIGEPPSGPIDVCRRPHKPVDRPAIAHAATGGRVGNRSHGPQRGLYVAYDIFRHEPPEKLVRRGAERVFPSSTSTNPSIPVGR